MATSPGDDRDAVRATYARYDDTRRERLWDRSNRGFDRLKSDTEREVVRLLRASIQGQGLRAVDVGCGSGEFIALANAAGLNLEWSGVDLIPERITIARLAAPSAMFVVASADAMPFEDASFDIAAAITLFSSIPSAAMEQGVASEIGRVLKPGGWLVWYDLRYDNPSNSAVHGVTRLALERLFPGWEQELSSSTLLPPLARRLGRATPMLYPVLHAFPPLRSHLIGRLRCPT
jgi:ubiquinone/menaquinone biosynthesis C-methylase UbiE